MTAAEHFDADTWAGIDESKKLGYNPTRYIQMVKQLGAVARGRGSGPWLRVLAGRPALPALAGGVGAAAHPGPRLVHAARQPCDLDGDDLGVVPLAVWAGVVGFGPNVCHADNAARQCDTVPVEARRVEQRRKSADLLWGQWTGRSDVVVLPRLGTPAVPPRFCLLFRPGQPQLT
jgi:hypothetical protein